MAITYHAGRRIQGTSTDVAPIQGGWKEVARTTLGSNTSTIDVSSLTDKRYYMILSSFRMATGGNPYVRLNTDTGNFYNQRYGINGGDSTFQTGRGRYGWVAGINTLPYFHVDFAANIATKEKLLIGNTVHQNTAGAGNAPNRGTGTWKHSQTSNPITSVNHWDNSGGDFASGSECVVLGYDPDDTHTDNFWEELASVSGDGTSTTLNSGTITAKKYLWFQVYGSVASQMDNMGWQFNSDTGSNYARRISLNGGTDGTSASQTYIRLGGGVAAGGSLFGSGFIINNSANEKLLTSHWVRNKTAGSGTAPERFETTGKWANTSSQITSLQFIHGGSSNWDSDSMIKVWGSN